MLIPPHRPIIVFAECLSVQAPGVTAGADEGSNATLIHTHYCGKTRDGRFLHCQKTQRMIRKLKELRQEMRRRMHQRLRDQHRWLAAVLRGHYAYFGIPGNSHLPWSLPSSGNEGVARGPATAKPTAEAVVGAVQRDPEGLPDTDRACTRLALPNGRDQVIRQRSRMRESCTSGSVRGASSDRRLYSTLSNRWRYAADPFDRRSHRGAQRASAVKATAMGEGGRGGAIFVNRAKARCPLCAPAFLGHTSRELVL